MPFHWSVNLIYNIMFGALPTYRDLSAGILVLYAGFFCLLFIAISWRHDKVTSAKPISYNAVHDDAQKQSEAEASKA